MSRLQTLRHRLHEASLDPSAWTSVLSDISAQYGCEGAVLINSLSSEADLPFSESMSDMMSDYRNNGWVRRDIRFAGTNLLLQNGIVTDKEFISSADIAKSSYYQDFLRKHNLRYSATIGGMIENNLWCIPIQKRCSKGDFEQDHLSELKILSAEFLDAARVAVVLGKRFGAGIIEGLSAINRPAILLGQRGEVRLINELASNLLGADIDVRQDTLQFGNSRVQAAFGRIFKAVRADATKPTLARNSDTLKSPSGEEFSFDIVRVRGWEKFSFFNAFALLTFNYVSRGTLQIDGTPLGLSKAEGRLALALCSGRSLRQCSVDFNISYETARSHLRSVFLKTGTSRQAELVSLLMTNR